MPLSKNMFKIASSFAQQQYRINNLSLCDGLKLHLKDTSDSGYS